jgi:hypothetical protein
MAFPELEPLHARLASDAELARAARHWTGALHLAVGGARHAVRFEAGRCVGAGRSSTPVGPRDVEVSATPEQWAKLLAPVPEAFWQDVFGAAAQHGVGFGGDVETMYAYYAALRRVLDILREARS